MTLAIDIIDTIEITSIDKVDTTSLNVTNVQSFEILKDDNLSINNDTVKQVKIVETPKAKNPFLDPEATIKPVRVLTIKSPFQSSFKSFMDIGFQWVILTYDRFGR